MVQRAGPVPPGEDQRRRTGVAAGRSYREFKQCVVFESFEGGKFTGNQDALKEFSRTYKMNSMLRHNNPYAQARVTEVPTPRTSSTSATRTPWTRPARSKGSGRTGSSRWRSTTRRRPARRCGTTRTGPTFCSWTGTPKQCTSRRSRSSCGPRRTTSSSNHGRASSSTAAAPAASKPRPAGSGTVTAPGVALPLVRSTQSDAESVSVSAGTRS